MKNSPTTLADRNRKRAAWKASIDPATIPKSILRICKECGQEQHCDWNYTFTQTGKPEYRTRCPPCFLRNFSQHRKKNRPRITRMILAWRTERKRKCIEILGGKCEDCGYNRSVRALTFHHKDPSTKTADVAKMIPNSSWEAVLEELKKCRLLCFNCHMEEEERLDDLSSGVRTGNVSQVCGPAGI
jgi:hypothetical protein